MTTKEQVLAALQGGTDYAAASERLGIRPGLAYLIATGLPADGSDVLPPDDLDRPGVLPTSTQHLANPPASKPDAGEVVHAWLRRRVAGDAQMSAAVRARTATPPTGEDPDAPPDVLDVLTRQHGEVTALVKQLDTIPGRSAGGTPAQASERESIVDMIRERLARHEAAEEEHLWPLVRDALPDGEEWAAQGTEQEGQATDTLRALADGDPQSEEWDDLVQQLMSQLHKHVAHEDQVFLRLREAVDEETRVRVGERVLAAQRAAPAGAHPRPADREGRPDPELQGRDAEG